MTGGCVPDRARSYRVLTPGSSKARDADRTSAVDAAWVMDNSALGTRAAGDVARNPPFTETSGVLLLFPLSLRCSLVDSPAVDTRRQ